MSPELSDELVSSVSYDIETGVLTWAKNIPHRREKARIVAVAGANAGRPMTNGYLQVPFHGERPYAHRVVWRVVTGSWPAGYIDHINGVKTDNRFCNLRDVSQDTNMQNTSLQPNKNNSVGLKGVSPFGLGYRAQIYVGGRGGKTIHLGYFESADDAHKAYVAAKIKLHAGFSGRER